jgi:hypothetical protein
MTIESRARSAVAESTPMAKDRKEIYIGESLRRALAGRKESLTTVANLIADRYMGMIERTNVATTVRMDDIYRAVLAERRGKPMEATDIATFPALVRDWLRRNPPAEDERAHEAALRVVDEADFVELVAIIDRLERSQ